MKPKSILALSLSLNVILVILGGVLLGQGRMRPAPRDSSETKAVAAVPVKEQPAPAAVAVAPEPFHWSQLESGDDAGYIRNLRSAGCPEGTIRDILSAAVGHRYDQKREDWHAKREKGEIDAVGFQQAISQSWDEQNDLLAALFGAPRSFGSGGVVSVAATSTSLGSPPPRRLPPGISTNTAPLVFLEPDPSWGLTDAQKLQWDQTYDRFVAAVGGPGQNASDPAYLERWQAAQVQADQQLKTLFGGNKVSQWQIQSRSRMPPPPAK